MNIQGATCKAELCAALMRADISVPARTTGRKKSHREIYTIGHLLSTLSDRGQFSYPLSVTHRDKPDFLLEMDASKIGVEVTEAISQEYAAYCALAARQFPGTLLEPAHFRWETPTLTVKEALSNAVFGANCAS